MNQFHYTTDNRNDANTAFYKRHCVVAITLKQLAK